jgi:dihydropteroate synthase
MSPDIPFSAARALRWQLRNRSIAFGQLPGVMGIVNVTPDSFSDGGHFFTPNTAIEQALRLEDEGADILDIGGESTRPYSQPVTTEDELRRIVPVIEALVGRVAIPISIDTSKSQVAQAAIDLGAEIINDVTGFEHDPNMVEVARNAQVGVCAMHMRGTPQTMQDDPSYSNVVDEIYQYLAARDACLMAAGIAPERICLDPGIGFGKTHEHSLELIRASEKFLALNRPILVGHSRKGFIGKLIGSKEADRTAGTLGVTLALARRGIQIVRVHDVKATRDALATFQASGGFA